MRITVIVAAIAFTLAGLAAADDATASIRKPTNIPPQPLGAALKRFAQDRDLQLLYFSESVRDLNTPGATGEITLDEALTRLLSGTGLTYRYLDDKTVTIVPVTTPTPSSSKTTSADSSPWGRFRLAQAKTGSEPPSTADEENADAETAGARKDVPEVLVKGSRSLNMDIERTSDDVQPYVVFDREAIKNSAARNIEDFLRLRLTSLTSPLSTSQSAGSGSNVSDISLRGLGSEQTLVLIDGHRAAPRNNTGHIHRHVEHRAGSAGVLSAFRGPSRASPLCDIETRHRSQARRAGRCGT